MDNPINWSFAVGDVAGIRVRIHLFFVIFVGIELLRAAGTGYFKYAAFGYLILFGIVFVHEMGHCFAARSVGGAAHEILMWPLGGLATVQAPNRPDAQLITTIGGPAVNFIFCALTAVILAVASSSFAAVPWNPLHPFHAQVTASWQIYLVFFFGLNYILLLFNLLPIYPMDGGRILQEILWFRMGYVRSLLIATRVGMFGAIALGIFGLLNGLWLVIAIAVFGYITCMQQHQVARLHQAQSGESFMGYDFSGGYGTFSGPADQRAHRPGFWQRHKEKQTVRRLRRSQVQRRLEEEEVDAILDKVRRKGIQSLTRREKRILENATARRRKVVP